MTAKVYPFSPVSVTTEALPGFEPARMIRLTKERIAACRLDLSSRIIMTEAASGAYAVTPIAAALAGAKEVIAITQTTAYGNADDIEQNTFQLAEMAGVPSGVISVLRKKDSSLLARADVVTNSGHVRPLDAAAIAHLKTGAVVPLMFEAWEIQAGRCDLDLDALALRGIAVAGTNECHPCIDVFSYLGTMAIKLLLDAGVPLLNASVALLCDNPFSRYIRSGLVSAGATVFSGTELACFLDHDAPDVLLVAQRPNWKSVLSESEVRWLSRNWPNTIIAQFWGDIDRNALADHGLRYWPTLAPSPGHMAILPSAIGPEPVIRLQVGGLKVAEVLLKPAHQRTPQDKEYLDAL